jgi:hypothetical protein
VSEERRRQSDADQSILHEIRDGVNTIKQTLYGPEGQPDEGFVKQTKDRLNNHAGRIGTLENWRTLVVGAGVVIFAILAWIAYVAIPLAAQRAAH